MPWPLLFGQEVGFYEFFDVPLDGSVVRQSTRARYDSDDQVEHEETRYEVIVGGEVIETEEYTRSP